MLYNAFKGVLVLHIVSKGVLGIFKRDEHVEEGEDQPPNGDAIPAPLADGSTESDPDP